MERDDIKVKTTVSWKLIDRAEQAYEEIINLDVDDGGKRISVTGTEIKRAIFPQEFLCIINHHKYLEFVGWWNNWDLSQPLVGADKMDRPITIVRRI